MSKVLSFLVAEICNESRYHFRWINLYWASFLYLKWILQFESFFTNFCHWVKMMVIIFRITIDAQGATAIVVALRHRLFSHLGWKADLRGTTIINSLMRPSVSLLLCIHPSVTISFFVRFDVCTTAGFQSESFGQYI